MDHSFGGSNHQFEDSELAQAYRHHRPDYKGSGLREKLANYLHLNGEEKLSLAVDVGCGQGQIIREIADYSKSIVGFDISEAQIDQARAQNTLPHVEYKVAAAEKLPLEDHSVDLITTGSALHWFDITSFYKEVHRVLHPGGAITVVTTSFHPTIIEHPKHWELNNAINESTEELFSAGYWHERYELVFGKYQSPKLMIPYHGSVRDTSLHKKVVGTIGSLFANLATRSYIHKYLKDCSAQGKEPELWNRFMKEFCDAYGDGTPYSSVTYKNDLVLLIGRKPIDGSNNDSKTSN